MNWKRIGRALVCLLVVFCLVLNMVSVRVEAFAVESIAIGVAAVMILLAAGVVFLPQTVNDVVAIGNSMQMYMYQWGEENEKLTEVEDWFVGIVFEDGGDYDGDGEPDKPHEKILNIATSIAVGLQLWAASVMKTGVSYQEAVSYECPLTLPEWDIDGYPYFVVIANPTLTLSTSYYLYCSKYPLISKGVSPAIYLVPEQSSGMLRCFYSGTKCEWESWKSGTYSAASFPNSEASSNTYEYVAFSNHDIFDSDGELYFQGNVTELRYNTMILDPEALVGEAAPAVKEGTASETELYVPEEIDYSTLLPSTETMVDDIISVSNDLATGTITHNYYIEIIQPDTETDSGTDPEPTETQPAVVDPNEPGTDSGGDSETEPTTGVLLPDNLGDTNAGTFLDTLVDAMTAPFEWLAETLLEGIKAIFVPSEDFLTEKVEALRAEFSFADSIMSAGELVGGTLQSLDTSPPVIYIDLGASRGSYQLGGEVPFIDLRWYAEYKPTVDTLLSALLWIVFIWRLFVKLPGIISGMPGDFVMDGLHQIGLADRLPARNAAYEVQRISIRQSVRKGPGQ